MRISKSVPELRLALAGAPRPLGLVPTLGDLHEGHASLVRRCRDECATVVVSIFVNPLQFDEQADFDKYPRAPDRDAALLEPLGVDVVFAPADFYADGFQTRIEPGGVAAGYEGAHRPGHFSGVCTVVAKLFLSVGCDRAYLGEKDAQQNAVIRRMIADLDMDVALVLCPTVRDADGLALSSRNARLSADERTRALGLSAGLFRAREAWRRGERSFETLAGIARDPALDYDYLACVDPDAFDRPGPLLVAAVRVGETRLIDNLRLDI